MGGYINTAEARLLGLSQELETLAPLMEFYSNLVDEYCNTRFIPTESSFSADPKERIRLPRLPLLSVAGVSYLGRPLTEGTDYFTYSEMGLVRMTAPDRYPKRRSILIRYQFGYERIPAAVKKAVADLIKLDYGGGDTGDTARDPSIVSETFGDYSYTKNASKSSEDLRRDVLAALNPFVQPPYEPELQEIGSVRARLL